MIDLVEIPSISIDKPNREVFNVELQEQMRHAAETMLTQCLYLPAGAEIVILADETTIDIANLLAKTASTLEIQSLLVYFDTQIQMTLRGKRLVPALETALRQAAAALICLNSRPECLPFRDQVRQTAWSPGCKVAHMPGISQNTLLLADVDYEALRFNCEMLALALAKGRQIEIVSWDQQGNEHSLQIPLEPWIRLPIISDGIIQPGSWGNVPSGETYIAPPEGLAEGTIVINGSVPGYRIRSGEEIILRFQKGHLVEWTPLDSPAAQHLERTEIEFARSQRDQNWSNLAEIGLGANPNVYELTGNPIFDEKKYGTVHIALGDNTDMGGQVESRIHCDMVCLSPKVSIDGKVILDKNEIVLQGKDWCEDYQKIELPPMWRSNLSLRSTAINTSIDNQGILKRLWDTSSGRVCSVPVGNDRTAQMAASIYQLIQRSGQPISIYSLAQQNPRSDLTQILKLTYLLKLYGLVGVLEENMVGRV